MTISKHVLTGRADAYETVSNRLILEIFILLLPKSPTISTLFFLHWSTVSELGHPGRSIKASPDAYKIRSLFQTGLTINHCQYYYFLSPCSSVTLSRISCYSLPPCSFSFTYLIPSTRADGFKALKRRPREKHQKIRNHLMTPLNPMGISLRILPSGITAIFFYD